METVLRDSGAPHRVLPWEPWGGDERQFCSPGFDLPVGTLMRTPHGEFSGYHTSADGLERIRPESLAEAVDTCLELVEVLESNRRCTQPEPVRRAAARAARSLSIGGRSGGHAGRRARPALGAQPERWSVEPARHRASLRVGLCGCRARRRAARAGGAACGELERTAVAGPRHDATLGRPRAASPGRAA